MKHIYLNLKRFDVPKELGGVNRIAKVSEWAEYIISNTKESLRKYNSREVEFGIYFPEVHILNAVEANGTDSPIKIGCQSVYRDDVAQDKNFGAYTSNRPAAAMKAAGCTATIIGHCEERNDLNGVLAEADVINTEAINRILNKEIKNAISQGLDVLYCVGEKLEEQESWQEVLSEQIDVGLNGVDKSKVVIAYEPIWSIGPGRKPADKDYITKIAGFIKEKTGGMDVVYGGGLKRDNAAMLASISEIDGGLIALTRFAGEIGYYPEEYLEIIKIYLDEQ